MAGCGEELKIKVQEAESRANKFSQEARDAKANLEQFRESRDNEVKEMAIQIQQLRGERDELRAEQGNRELEKAAHRQTLAKIKDLEAKLTESQNQLDKTKAELEVVEQKLAKTTPVENGNQ